MPAFLIVTSLFIVGTPPSAASMPFDFDGNATDFSPSSFQPLLHFVENQGQTTDGVRFYSTGNPSFAFWDDGVMVLSRQDGDPIAWANMIRFVGSNHVTPTGLRELPFKSNYFLGNEPAKWRTSVPSFEEVAYFNIYDGIDLVYRSVPNGAKYNFVIHPYANPSMISMRYEGVESIRVEDVGLVTRNPVGDIVDAAPYSYMDDGGEVSCAFEPRGENTIGFACDEWDGSSTLTIDPLMYSTFLGGGSSDYGLSIAVDSSFYAYVSGYSPSLNFPVTPGAFDTSYNGVGDGFVAKVNPTGTALVYATYIGGSRVDRAISIAIDSSGNAYITGSTGSSNFPATLSSYDPTYNGNFDAFVAKLNATGDALVYSTYLGNTGGEEGRGIAVDSNGNAYISGNTSSTNFPTTSGAYDRSHNGGWLDIFVAKLNSAGSGLSYSTFLGGDESDGYWWNDLQIDSNGNAYITGDTGSSNFPTTGSGYQRTFGGGTYDVFVTKLSSSGGSLSYSTFIGDSASDWGVSIDLDSNNNAYVAGYTNSNNFPTTGGAYDTSFNGGQYDAFVSKLNSAGSSLSYSTFMGTSGSDQGRGIDVDSGGSACITGWTDSGSFPTTSGGYDRSHNGQRDAFVTRLNTAGSSLSYSTFLGGVADDEGHGIADCTSRHIFVTGNTWSSNFPTTVGAINRTLGMPIDAFATRIILSNSQPVADAGPDYNLDRNFVGNLDGSGSSDSNGDSLTYFWTQVSGPPTTITNPTNVIASIRPQSLGPHEFRLTVEDPYGGSDTDNVIVTVVNSPPTADAGPDLVKPRNVAVNLDGRGSSDPNQDPLTYQWRQIGGAPVTINNPTSALAWFVPGPSGIYSFRLNVSDPYGGLDSDDAVVTAYNRDPVAEAGSDQVVIRNQNVTLDGSGSTDPDGDMLTYDWTQIFGPPAAIDNQSSAITWIIPVTIGLYSFRLLVTDPYMNTSTDITNVTVINMPPTADAGPDQVQPKGVRVDLNGSLSADPENRPLTYQWIQLAGPPITLNSPNTATPWFIGSEAGYYTFDLNVTDDVGDWDVDVVNVTIGNRPPVADAGPDQNSFKQMPIILDGSNSSDPDLDNLTFLWTQIRGPTVTLSGSTTENPTFTPTVSGVYVFNLTVDDNAGGTANDTVNVTVVNRAPSSNAGVDQNLLKKTLVTLDGTASLDPDADTLSYSWIQISGPAVSLSGANTTNPTFTPPLSGTYVFSLTVDDGDGGSSGDNVNVTATNRDPVANAGSDKNVAIGILVTLNGSGSSDPDGDTLTYNWVQTGGPVVTLSGATTVVATFTPPSAATYTFRLEVMDDDGGVDLDDVMVTAITGVPPVAVATVWPGSFGYIGTDFVFDGSNSTDPGGSIVEYVWDFGDGNTTTGTKVLYSYMRKGSFHVTLTVTDDSGLDDDATLSITIQNRGPVITQKSPTGAVNIEGNTTQLFTITATDPDNDPLTYIWRLDTIQVGTSPTSYAFNSSVIGQHVLNITVSDGSLSDWHAWSITVRAPGEPPPDDDDNDTDNKTDNDPGGFPVLILIPIIIVVMVMLAIFIILKKRKKTEEKDEEGKDAEEKESKEEEVRSLPPPPPADESERIERMPIPPPPPD